MAKVGGLWLGGRSRRAERLCLSGTCRPVDGDPLHSPNVKWEAEHLWLYLLALGFDPAAVGDGVELGRMMFSKPNSRAFHAIALFLFTKLDQFRAAKVFGTSSFPAEIFTASEFRKQCNLWLQDIANEEKYCLPKIVPSLLISPAGPKFVHLMYRFARCVVIKDMTRNSVGTDIPFAEAVKLTPKDKYMANARHRVAYNKLLQVFQNEDLLIQEYKKKEQLLIKEIKEIMSEYSVLKVQSCKVKQNDQNKNDKTERIQKVRSMWTLITEILTSLKKEREVVDYALEGCVGQYVLDGANVVCRVPQLLACRIENEVQHWRGNVYEAEKLNFLTVIQLLNEALRTLRDELRQSELTSHLTYIKDIRVSCTEILQNLQEGRLKLDEEHYVPRSGSISTELEDWEAKWKSLLGLCPFNLMFEQDPQLRLRPLPPHSSDPAKENDEDNIFCEHLLSVSGLIRKKEDKSFPIGQLGKEIEGVLPDVCDSVHEVRYEKDDQALETMMDKLTPPSRWVSAVPLESSKASENRDVLIEESLHTETCKVEKMPVPPKILKNGKDKSAISELSENAGDHVIQTESPVKKEDPLKKAKDKLAEEFAKAVMSESSESGEKEGMSLEDLSSSLAFNPFLTRKQIPRTPENLLTEIRSSWRKAIQTEGSSDKELAPTEVMIEEAPMDARPSVLPSDHFQGSLTERMLNQNVSALLRSVTCEASDVWIFDEPFPEFDNIGTPKFSSLESDFDLIDSTDVTDGSKNKGDIKNSKLDLQYLFNTREALKKTASRSEEDLHQTHNGDESVSCRSGLSLTPEKRERNELCSPPKFFCLDEEFTKTSSPISLNERKYSLSSLLVSSQHLERMASIIHKIPLDITDKLQGKEQSNVEPGTKEPSSG